MSPPRQPTFCGRGSGGGSFFEKALSPGYPQPKGSPMFDIQSYQKAESVSDAIRLLGEDPEARLIAGGTDVLI